MSLLLDGKKSYVRFKDVKVFFESRLDGGGSFFGQEFVQVVRKSFGKVGRLCEFAAGPGFIGYSLLAHGLCDSLCLVDINPRAVNIAEQTARENNLESRVKVYLSDGLRDIPELERWDLVVSNPPMFNGTNEDYEANILKFDPSWRIHRNFYDNVARFMSEGGSIIFMEHMEGSKPDFWEEFIKPTPLQYVGYFRLRRNFKRGDLIRYYQIALLHRYVDSSLSVKRTPQFFQRSVYSLLSFAIKGRPYPYYYVHSKLNKRPNTDLVSGQPANAFHP